MAAGEADADAHERLHFFIKEDDKTLSVEGKEPDEPAAQKRIEAEYDEFFGTRMGREPVEVGTWTTSPMEFGLNITIENMSLWWEEIDEGYNNQCEWTFYIYHNGQEISQNTVECQSDGEELSRETYNIGTSIELNSSDTFAIEIWYEGWEDVDLYYDNLTYDSGSGVVCENSCQPLPEAIIESVSLHQAENGTLVEFNGSGTTDYGQISDYLWESSIDGNLSNAPQFNTTNLSLGNHSISFSVGNTEGFSSEKATAFVWIYAVPVASANHSNWNDAPPKDKVEPGDEVIFKGGGSDEDGVIILYEWDFNGYGNFDWNSTDTGSTTFVYNNEGTYTAVFRLTDNDGFTATDSRVITVGDGGGGGGDDDGGGIPAPSLAAAVAAVAVIALRRRPRKP